MPLVDVFTRLAVALSIGLLIGLERGWQSRDEADQARVAGLRTFALSGLLGGVSGALSSFAGGITLGLIFVGFMAALIAFSWLEARETKNLSATALIAAAVTFALGAYAMLGYVEVAAAGGVAAMGLLALRDPLHRWVASLRWEEIRAVLVLLAMTFLLLPILPDEAIDPWGILNPHVIWLLAILVAGISFVGYVAVRVFGDRLGILAAAAAGGLASSTAATLTFARLARQNPESAPVLAGGILIAGAVMVVRVGIVVLLLDQTLALHLWPALAAAAAVLAVSVAILLLRPHSSSVPALVVANPLEIGSALKLTAFIVAVTVGIYAVRRVLGNLAILAAAALSGVADVDAATVSLSRLVPGIGIETAAAGILIAAAVNTLAKTIISASIGTPRLGLLVAIPNALALAAGAAAFLLAR
jgi:uncharacterized membrane protein (DUF4010 family)